MEKCSQAGCPSANKKKPEPQAEDERLTAALGRIKHKLLVMSGKGGVGKTSVSVNLAIALAHLGHKVGIVDVDIHGPDVPRMLGFDQMLEMTPEQQIKPLAYSENLSVVSIEGLIPNKDDAIIWRGPMKYNVIQQFISEVAWGDLDFLVIDAPPGTGDEPLTIAQKIKDAKAIIVTTPQEVALADVRKSINFCRTVKMEIAGLIENMSGFDCPHCQKAISLFGSGGGQKTANDMGIPFLGRIPFDLRMVACGDNGTSFQEAYADTPVTAAFIALAAKLNA